MADIIAIKDYFKKLQKVLISEAEFTFFSYKMAKKTKVDDLLCCILAVLPESYKKALKQRISTNTDANKYISVTGYNRLSKVIKKPFILSKDIYVYNYGEVDLLIKSIITNIERDIIELDGI